jgi:hypothetical protein
MNKELEMKLEKIKNALGDDCEYMALAYMEESKGNLLEDCKAGLEEYYDVKNKYNDLWFGDVMLWVDEETFNERQVYIMIYELQRPEDWICMGEVGPYPLMLNKRTGIVNCVLSEPGLKCEMKEYAKFDVFMDKYVLGEKYFELGTDEEWYDFMKEHGII